MLKAGRGAQSPAFLVMDVVTAANACQAALPPGARLRPSSRSRPHLVAAASGVA